MFRIFRSSAHSKCFVRSKTSFFHTCRPTTRARKSPIYLENQNNNISYNNNFVFRIFTRKCQSNQKRVEPLTQEERVRIYKKNLEKKREKEQQKNASVGKIAIMMIIGAVGLSYAAVPLYQMFCSATGYGGTAIKEVDDKSVKALSNKSIRPDRPLVINFVGQSSGNIPWTFVPLQKEVTCVPGESVLAFYNAKNKSDEPVVGLSIYNVVPSKAAIYFNKVQCFCFEEQRLEAGESVDMPVLFFIDPEFGDDPSLFDVRELTLSYTFFRVSGDVDAEILEKAMEEGQIYAEQQAKKK